jgi:hypothetical protein
LNKLVYYEVVGDETAAGRVKNSQAQPKKKRLSLIGMNELG